MALMVKRGGGIAALLAVLGLAWIAKSLASRIPTGDMIKGKIQNADCPNGGGRGGGLFQDSYFEAVNHDVEGLIDSINRGKSFDAEFCDKMLRALSSIPTIFDPTNAKTTKLLDYKVKFYQRIFLFKDCGPVVATSELLSRLTYEGTCGILFGSDNYECQSPLPKKDWPSSHESLAFAIFSKPLGKSIASSMSKWDFSSYLFQYFKSKEFVTRLGKLFHSPISEECELAALLMLGTIKEISTRTVVTNVEVYTGLVLEQIGLKLFSNDKDEGNPFTSKVHYDDEGEGSLNVAFNLFQNCHSYASLGDLTKFILERMIPFFYNERRIEKYQKAAINSTVHSVRLIGKFYNQGWNEILRKILGITFSDSLNAAATDDDNYIQVALLELISEMLKRECVSLEDQPKLFKKFFSLASQAKNLKIRNVALKFTQSPTLYRLFVQELQSPRPKRSSIEVIEAFFSSFHGWVTLEFSSRPNPDMVFCRLLADSWSSWMFKLSQDQVQLPQPLSDTVKSYTRQIELGHYPSSL